MAESARRRETDEAHQALLSLGFSLSNLEDVQPEVMRVVASSLERQFQIDGLSWTDRSQIRGIVSDAISDDSGCLGLAVYLRSDETFKFTEGLVRTILDGLVDDLESAAPPAR